MIVEIPSDGISRSLSVEILYLEIQRVEILCGETPRVETSLCVEILCGETPRVETSLCVEIHCVETNLGHQKASVLATLAS